MWRIARTVMIFLLLGLMINITIAWSLRPINGWHPAQINVGKVSVILEEPTAEPVISVSSIVMYDTAYDHLFIEPVDGSSATEARRPGITFEEYKRLEPRERYVGTYTSGWPCRAFCYWIEFATEAPKLFTGEGATIRGGLPIRGSTGIGYAARALPLIPVLPGALINTLLYASALWLLFGMPFTLRRARRIHAHRCPACAYPFGTSATCTECGRDVSKWINASESERSAPSPRGREPG